jgi:hypothetical protein
MPAKTTNNGGIANNIAIAIDGKTITVETPFITPANAEYVHFWMHTDIKSFMSIQRDGYKLTKKDLLTTLKKRVDVYLSYTAEELEEMKKGLFSQ